VNARLTRVIIAAVVAGLAILSAFLIYESVNTPRAAEIIGYQRTGDARKIVMIIATGLQTDVLDRKVDEDGRSVRVTVHVRPPAGPVDSIAIVLPVLITLREPLGDRAVLDDRGRPVEDRGAYELPGVR